MKRKILVASLITALLLIFAIAIAFALSLPPLFDRAGQRIDYETFWSYVENEEIAAAVYSERSSMVFFAVLDSGKTIDDLPHNSDYFVKVQLPELWRELNDYALTRQKNGKTADYGFDFAVETRSRTSYSFFNVLPYLILMIMLTLALVVMIFVNSKIRRRQRLLRDQNKDAG